jgi:hypothetical protein
MTKLIYIAELEENKSSQEADIGGHLRNIGWRGP